MARNGMNPRAVAAAAWLVLWGLVLMGGAGSAERLLKAIEPAANISEKEMKKQEFIVRVINFFWQPGESSYHRVWPEMEFGWRLVLGSVIGFFGAALGSVGGVGGGGIFVPMLALIIGFDPKASTAISKCMIMGAAGSTVYFNLRLKHPTLDIPLIDYDLALLFQPMLMLGISIGVAFNVIFADWMVTILLIILFLGASTKALFKGIDTWKKESMLKKEAEKLLESESKPVDGSGADYKPLPSGPTSSLDDEVSLFYNIYWKELALLVYVWVAFLAVQIIKVDFSGIVDDEFLERLGLEKGTRKVVNHEERGRVLRAMDGCSYKAAAGGSLSNTLVALARLGGRPIGSPVLNVAMAGSIGSDPLGGFYRTKLRRANVNFLSAPVKDGTTGTVIVLTTPDAQRTMLAYQGMSSTVNYDPCLASIIAKTNILVVEGYLFEFPNTIKTIAKACEDAHRSGALVAVTASDVSCIERHYDDFWEIIGNYADIVFANSDEARALCNFSSKESPDSGARYLSHFVPLISVTDGPKGSYIGVKGEAVYIPPSPCVPVDTCGAGDAYASGILYGILRGVSDLKGMGTLAARVAAVVVGQQGTRLRVQDAVELAESFAFHLDSTSIRYDVGSEHISSL